MIKVNATMDVIITNFQTKMIPTLSSPSESNIFSQKNKSFEEQLDWHIRQGFFIKAIKGDFMIPVTSSRSHFLT